MPSLLRYFRKSCLADNLTEEEYEKYCNVIGPRGYTFDMAIQCGIDTKSGTGFAVPDEESYVACGGPSLPFPSLPAPAKIEISDRLRGTPSHLAPI